jgi:hypothetical protein
MDATRSVSDTKHSPALSADLSIHGQKFTVAALGPEHVVVRSPCPVAAGEGIIHFTMDDHLTTYRIDLPQGIDPTRREQNYRLLETRVMPPINAA